MVKQRASIVIPHTDRTARLVLLAEYGYSDRLEEILTYYVNRRWFVGGSPDTALRETLDKYTK